jgi:hypothetical protein
MFNSIISIGQACTLLLSTTRVNSITPAASCMVAIMLSCIITDFLHLLHPTGGASAWLGADVQRCVTPIGSRLWSHPALAGAAAGAHCVPKDPHLREPAV